MFFLEMYAQEAELYRMVKSEVSERLLWPRRLTYTGLQFVFSLASPSVLICKMGSGKNLVK